MPIRRSQKKRNAEPRPKQNQRRLVIDPMVNPGSSAHRHQARSKAHPTRTHHRMVTLAQSSPGDRSAFAPQSKTATVMLSTYPYAPQTNRALPPEVARAFDTNKSPLKHDEIASRQIHTRGFRFRSFHFYCSFNAR